MVATGAAAPLGNASEFADLPKFEDDTSVEWIKEELSRIETQYDSSLRAIAALDSSQLSFESTFGAFAAAHAAASTASAHITLPAMVSGDKEVRAASTAAKDALKAMFDSAFMQRDLYEVFKLSAKAVEDGPARAAEEARLVRWVLLQFRRRGADLPVEDQHLLSRKAQEVEALCSRFCSHIFEDTTAAAFTEAELEGCAPDFIRSLPEAPNGTRTVTLKAPDTQPVLQYAWREATRRRLTHTMGSKCQGDNTELLVQALHLRHQCAELLGYPSHAHFMLETKMAQTPEAVAEFQGDISAKLEPALASDLAALQALKEEDHRAAVEAGDSAVETAALQAWDVAFYSRKHKETLGVDEDALREYFPMGHVKRQVMAVYERLLGLQFEAVQGAPVWHEEVELYAVRDASSGALEGYFYMDLHPREGKYSHQCVYPLRPAFERAGGARSTAACVIIGNMTRAGADGTPALMRFREVETFFHEFGHVMHCVCSRPSFSPFAWAWSAVPWPGGVENDFLEVPSMMLENWVYEPDVLQALSSHHLRPAEHLHAQVVERLRESRHALTGIGRRRFLHYALYDMHIHSERGAEWTAGELQRRFAGMHEQLVSLALPEAVFPAASWLHIMMGYDAGYYSYLWSEAFAADLITVFEEAEGGMMDATVGERYRRDILAPCAALDGGDMLRNFLGREPTTAPFLKRIGVDA